VLAKPLVIIYNEIKYVIFVLFSDFVKNSIDFFAY
jgi:hypothetical protein